MIRRLFLAFVAAAALSAGAARASILETYASSGAFLAAFPVLDPNTITFGPAGVGPFINLMGSAASASAGLVTITASTGNLFGVSTVLSTEIDQAALVLTFSQPIQAVGLSALITDELFAAIDGELLIEAVGSGSEDLIVTDAGASFIGLRSDIAFSSLRISVSSFDQNASAVAIASLSDTLYPAMSTEVSVPAPGSAALLVPLIALALARRTTIKCQHG